MNLEETTTSILLAESFKNMIGPESKPDREKYADQVWDILQKSYKKIGGIKGSGFRSKQDMIDNIPFWKIFTRNGKVITAAMYKDKNGRKGVAYATDGSADGIGVLAQVFKQDIGRSYEELSGPALVFMMKQHEFDAIKPYLIKPSQVAKTMKKDVDPVDLDELDPDDVRLYKRYPELKDYFYTRKLGDGTHLKLSLGTTGKTIK